MIKIHTGLHLKYPLFLFDFNETGIFSPVIFLNHQISNFMKIRPVGAEMFHAEGKERGTDTTKLIVAFCEFCERA
jgi:hypothetical protein